MGDDGEIFLFSYLSHNIHCVLSNLYAQDLVACPGFFMGPLSEQPIWNHESHESTNGTAEAIWWVRLDVNSLRFRLKVSHLFAMHFMDSMKILANDWFFNETISLMVQAPPNGFRVSTHPRFIFLSSPSLPFTLWRQQLAVTETQNRRLMPVHSHRW